MKDYLVTLYFEGRFYAGVYRAFTDKAAEELATMRLRWEYGLMESDWHGDGLQSFPLATAGDEAAVLQEHMIQLGVKA